MSETLLTLIAFELAVALAGAVVGGVIAHRLGQPLFVGYLAAGIALSPHTPGHSSNPELLGPLANGSVALLLFILAVQFPYATMARRPVAGFLAVVQVLAIGIVATVVAISLGLDTRAAVVVGPAVGTSSWLLAGRVLARQLPNEMRQLAFAWSMVQGATALAISTIAPDLVAGDPRGLWLVLVPATLVPASFLAGRAALGHVLSRLNDPGGELGQLVVIGLALVAVVAPVLYFGFPIALAGLAAGLLVGGVSRARAIAVRLLRLREVFVAIFLVSVGVLLNPLAILDEIAVLAMFVAAVFVLKWFASTTLARASGAPRRHALLVGAGLANFGEFTFAIAQEGLARGLVDWDTHQLLVGTTAASAGTSALTLQAAGSRSQHARPRDP